MLLDAVVEGGLEPEDQSVGFALAQQVDLEDPIDLDDLLVGDLVEVEVEDPCYFADDEGGVDDSNDWLLGNPLLDGGHGDAVDIVPELHFVIVEELVVNDCTLEVETVWEDESLLGQEQIPGPR